MNGTKNDVDPTTELLDEDEEQALPEAETAIDTAIIWRPWRGRLAAGRAVINQPRPHAPSSPGVYA